MVEILMNFIYFARQGKKCGDRLGPRCLASACRCCTARGCGRFTIFFHAVLVLVLYAGFTSVRSGAESELGRW